MSKIYDLMIEVKTKLATIPNIKTLEIGLEKGIGSKDCPFIRIIPEMNTPTQNATGTCGQQSRDELTFQIVFGFDLKNQELPQLYSEYYDLEEQIRAKILTPYTKAGVAQFVHTVTDEDKLPTLKSAISRFKIKGIR